MAYSDDPEGKAFPPSVTAAGEPDAIAIDHQYYPHIIDGIWRDIDCFAALTSRLVSRDWSKRVDRDFQRHVAATQIAQGIRLTPVDREHLNNLFLLGPVSSFVHPSFLETYLPKISSISSPSHFLMLSELRTSRQLCQRNTLASAIPLFTGCMRLTGSKASGYGCQKYVTSSPTGEHRSPT